MMRGLLVVLAWAQAQAYLAAITTGPFPDTRRKMFSVKASTFLALPASSGGEALPSFLLFSLSFFRHHRLKPVCLPKRSPPPPPPPPLSLLSSPSIGRRIHPTPHSLHSLFPLLPAAMPSWNVEYDIHLHPSPSLLSVKSVLPSYRIPFISDFDEFGFYR